MVRGADDPAALPLTRRGGAPPAAGTNRPLVHFRARRFGDALLALQLLGLLVLSTIEYQSFALGRDFAVHAQAWLAIAHGHLDPWSTLYGSPFWQGNAEFLTWPLALLYYVYPHSIDLLWVQDFAVVATEFVAFAWICELLERRRVSVGPQAASHIAMAALAAMVINPWCYQTIAYDVHAQVLTGLFALLALRTLWRGRSRPLVLWVPLTLLSAGLGGAATFAVGLSGVLAGKAYRKVGIALALVGLGWTVVLGQFGAIAGNGNVVNWYAYLTGPTHHVGPVQILLGVLHHPGAALRVMAGRADLIFLFLSTVGLVGVVWPWALPTTLVVIAPSALNSDAYFLQVRAAFQTWPALPVTLVGTIAVLLWLPTRWRRGMQVARVVVAGWAAALIPLAVAGIADVPGHWLAVDGPAAAQLQTIARTVPSDAELVASQGVIGRFLETTEVYDFWTLGQKVPVRRRDVIFLLTPEQGASPTPPWQTRLAIAFVANRLGAQPLVRRHGVFEFVWRAPAGTDHVIIS
jgi:hypothetical protein